MEESGPCLIPKFGYPAYSAGVKTKGGANIRILFADEPESALVIRLETGRQRPGKPAMRRLSCVMASLRIPSGASESPRVACVPS